jgi:ParB-like chromosome segregation protein Spo0J
MYNEYDGLSFEEQLHLTEEEIIRRHNQQMFLHRNAQLLQQELSLEAELLEENPELAQTIHALNMREIQSNQRGLENVLGSEESGSKEQSVWSKFLPGLGGR